jgi:arylsulfatase A-like enzyme
MRGVLRAALLTLLVAVQAAGAPESPSRPNVILISIDTLRADHLSAYGYARETAPRIAAFARRAIVFEEAWSHSPKTAASHMSLMTGLYPEVHGVGNPGSDRVRVRLSDEIPTLAELLRRAGYRTRALHGGGNVRAEFGFERGFERYVEERELSAWLQRAREVVLEQEASPGAPLFLFLHTYEVHAPYDPPVAHARLFVDPEYAGRIVASPEALARKPYTERMRFFWKQVDASSPEDLRHLADLYDAGIHYTDAQLGAFLEWLETRPLWRDTLLVLLSDHGEEFGEHGALKHTTLHRETLHVPLVVRFPGDDPATRPRRIPAVVRLIDVMPSLLDFVGVPAPAHPQGRSLLPLLRSGTGEPALVLSQIRQGSAAALRVGDWKLIRAKQGERLYRLSSDPGERVDLREAEPERAAQLAAQLDALLAESAALRASFAALDSGEIDAETLEQLRALGYLPPEETREP